MGTLHNIEFINVRENPVLRHKAERDNATRQPMLRRIGVFELVNGVYEGHIATLNFRCRARIKENPHRKAEAEPEYIVEQHGGEAFYPDLGYAWERKTAGQSLPYLSVHIDDPAFPKTIVAVLVKGPGNYYHLYWDRVTITDDDIEILFITEEMLPYTGVLRPIAKLTDYLASIYPLLAEQWGGYEEYEL